MGGGTPLDAELALFEVTPGAQTGLMGLLAALGFPSGTLVRCHAYFQRVDQEVQAWIANHRTERGTPLSKVFQDELELGLADQARFLIYREMLRAAGPEIPAPSLTGQYFLLRGAGFLGSLATGSGEGATRGSTFFGGTAGLGKGAASGALVGALQGAGNELQRMLDILDRLLSPAVFLTWWGPYIMGMVNLVLLGLFPIVLIWSLFPRAQFQPIATYFATLFFTTSMPLWWALVDVAARLAKGVPPEFWVAPGQWAEKLSASFVITSIGILLIPVVIGMLIMGSWRAIGGLWRGHP
jgi:hypothetical protein